MPTTPNYTIPTDGGSTDTWGGILNTAIIDIDADIVALTAVDALKVPLAGGTMTGRLDVLTAACTIVDKGTGSGAQSLNCAAAQAFTLTMNGATILSITNVPTGFVGVILKVVGGSAGLTHPSGTVWASGAAPTMSAGTDLLAYLTFNGGSTWIGIAVALAVA
jgi:hypothetical protein